MEKPTTRWEVFKILREFFEKAEGEEAEATWDALTGLRGPDDGNDDNKAATTAVIRQHMLGPNIEGRVCADFSYDSAERLSRRRTLKGGEHFEEHARRAFVALGLGWHVVNVEKKEK